MHLTDKLAKEYITLLLKENGFIKQRLSWNRIRDPFVDIINIQKLPGSTENDERFVLNIGVFIPEYYETVWHQPYKRFVNEVDAIFRTRLGDLLKDEFSKNINSSFITLNSDSDVSKVGKELSLAIEKRVIPCLDSFISYQSLHDYIESDDGWYKNYPLMQIYFALMKQSLGDTESATAILDDLIERKNKAWVVHAQRIKTLIKS